ncbi:hypothetical protein DM02DRAFT_728712 [Periconia macrospinosa]|uniref:Jacalin-type lectin domain-containing protein n=1 Tax=Periconia macrospinosa TaxID=97972 RepID=A0A2V1DSI1_9PLEO|nr:hypothetical protein DM02DRAFT_728712 [Periconia macrospinosa]
MVFSLKAAAKAAALFSILGLSAAADMKLCNDGPFDKTKTVGRENKNLLFCDTKWDQGKTVTGIEVWATASHFKAIQISYSDGTKGPIRGDALNTEDKDGNWLAHKYISWKQSDPVRSVSLGSNILNNNDGLGVVKMEVGGQTLDAKSNVGTFNGDPQLVSSGILIGAFGSSGGFVESFGLMFLKTTVGKAEIVEIKIPQNLEELNKKQEGVEEFTVKTAQYKNSGKEGSGDQTFTFKSTTTYETSTSLQQANSHTFGAEVSISASASVGIPIFAQASIETTASTGFENTEVSQMGSTKKSADSLVFGQEGVLPPGKGAECKATAQRGTYDSDYSSRVRITLDGGQQFFLDQPGHVRTVGFSDAQVDCKVVDIQELDPEVPTKEIAGEKKDDDEKKDDGEEKKEEEEKKRAIAFKA